MQAALMLATTLYERIGGAPTVERLVDAFYQRVLADEKLRPFFEGVAVERLIAMQKEFFGAALDGPVQTSQSDLAGIHHNMGITRDHLTRFVNCLVHVLNNETDIAQSDAVDITFRIATYSDEVLGGAGGTDG